MKTRQQRRQRRQAHIRKTVRGTAERPRLSIFRSSKHIYAQIIDDTAQITLAAANDAKDAKGTPTEKATKVGNELAKQAKTKKITKVVLDRGGYKYHGRIKALADAARAAGLEF